ncbi:class F sortase [Serinicoccus sediminis]|uniref:class F sortase n=1 Tax=Serinicoccus sediminis TaxID=2306021 RepID=UPI00101ECEBC|nr:class F sortase [Serinicoccus sediminis]
MDTSPGARRRSVRRGVTLMLLTLALVGALVTIWGWRGAPTVAGPDTTAPTTAPSAAVTAAPPEPVEQTPTMRHTPTPRAASSSAPPSPTPSPTPGATEPAPMADTQQGPVHVTVSRGDDVLVDAPVALTQLNDRDELNPPPGVVGWYGPPEWSTVPGDLSSYPGVLAGHTSYDGARDVFQRLGEVRAGDVVVVRYADGGEATFSADADALSVPKNDVTDKAGSDYAWVWSLVEPGRKVSLFSCDPSQGIDLTGHSHNNWVVQATRTA